MLILKNPLTLQSISAFGIYSDSLGQKICGNYQTFGTAVTGADLIHMTMQEPDIYVAVENNGPFLVDSRVHVDNQVRVELVNRLVNRLMLYPSPQFTYQDEVFVTTVLHKLGVADVNEFMQQVRLHRETNELAVSLINKYFDEGREFAHTVNELLEHYFDNDSQEVDIIKNEYRSDRCLHNDIFRRLMTAECSNAVYSYQNLVQVRERLAGSFHEIEWMRQADRIQLSQLRANILWQTNPAVLCEYSGYETRPLAVSELTRQKVIDRMSAVILENIVSVAGYALQYAYGSTSVWKDYSRILYQSAESALERFYYFQENGGVEAARLNAYTVRMNELTRDELHLAQMLEFVERPDVPPEGDALYEGMQQSIVLTILENQNLQKQLTRRLQMIQQARVWESQEYFYQKRFYHDAQDQYLEEQERFESVYRILRQKKSETCFSTVMQEHDLDGRADSLRTDGAQALLAEIDEENARREHAAGLQKALAGQIRNVRNEMRNEIKNDRGAGQRPAQDTGSGQVVYALIRRYAEQERDSDVPLMENIELLEQINQHNLYMKQLLDSREPGKGTPRRVVVDRAQAREAALRALEHPEQVLREIYENAAGERHSAGGIASQMPDEVRRILSVTDERTRSYYERLMGYRSDDAPGVESESGGRDADKTAVPGQSGQCAAENVFQETIRAVLNTTDRGAQILYRQSGAGYQRVDVQHLRETPGIEIHVLTQEERTRRRDVQERVYTLLRWIDRRERAYRTDTTVQTQELEQELRSEAVHRQIADIQHTKDFSDIKEIVRLEHRDTVRQQGTVVSQSTEANVRMVYRTREQTNQEIVDEVLKNIEDSKFSRQSIEERNEETLLTQRQIKDLRNELITQSREQVTNIMEQNMKTYVHELSDRVYLELERRLKNEQRRRGY